jgi:hypothetical protein
MTTPRRRLGPGTKLILIVIAVLVLLWCGYWFATNRIAASTATELIASLAADGRAVGCTQNSTGGFPFSLDLDCSQATFKDQKAGTSVALSRITATAPLYWPGSVSAVIAAPMVLDAPAQGASLDAEWANAAASFDAGLSGLNRAAVELDGLTVTSKDAETRLPFSQLVAGHTEAFAEPAAGHAYRFYLLADNIKVKPPKGKDYPEIAAEVDATAHDVGGSLGTNPWRAVTAWLSHGGTIDVTRIGLSLGDASIEASGTLELSPDGVVSGKLDLRLTDLKKLPAMIDKIRPGSRDKVAQLIGAAGMVTKPVEGDQTARDAPLVIRDGVVSVGVIPVGTIPPLKF